MKIEDLTLKEYLFFLKAKRAALAGNLYPCSYTSKEILFEATSKYNLEVAFIGESEYKFFRQLASKFIMLSTPKSSCNNDIFKAAYDRVFKDEN